MSLAFETSRVFSFRISAMINPGSAKTNIRWLKSKNSKFVAICAVSCLLALVTVAGISANPQCETLDLDCSWVIDAQFKLLHGQLSGRDYVFTYGPLSQVIFRMGMLADPRGIVVNSTPFLQLGPSLVSLTLLILAIALIHFANWKTSVVILPVVFATLNTTHILRPLTAIIVIILLTRAVYKDSYRETAMLSAIAGAVCFLGQLVTFEIGIISIIGAIIVVVIYNGLRPLCAERLKNSSIALGSVLSIYGLLNVLISTFYKISSPQSIGLFDYQYYNFQIVRSYAYTMITPWVLDKALGLTIIGMIIFCIVAIAYHFHRVPDDVRCLFISILFLALLQLKSAGVRNDEAHVLLAITPLLLLFLLLAYGDYARRGFSIVALLLVAALAATSPDTGKWLHSLRELLTSPGTVYARVAQAREYTMRVTAVAPEDFQAKLAPDSDLLVFPYENIISVALGRNSITPVLQAYSAHNTVLQQYYISNIQKAQDAVEVVYCTRSTKIDNVDHITRSPLIFEYLLQHFDIKQAKVFDNGCTILQPRKQAFTIPATQVNFQANTADGRTRLTFSGPTSCTLLRLDMSIAYPLTGALGRPTPATVQVLSNGQVMTEQNVVPIDVGRPFTTYVYLGDSTTSYVLFDPERALGETREVDALELGHASLGPFDVYPRSAQIQRVECINLGPGEVVEVQPANNKAFGPILATKPLRQEFTAERDNLRGVLIRLATYNRVNSGLVTLALKQIEPSGGVTLVASATVDAATIQDNEFFLLRFARQKSLGQHYELEITTTQNSPDHAITAWMQQGDPYPMGRLFAGDREINADATFQLLYARL